MIVITLMAGDRLIFVAATIELSLVFQGRERLQDDFVVA